MIKRLLQILCCCLALEAVSCPESWTHPVIGDPSNDDQFSELRLLTVASSTIPFLSSNSQSLVFPADSDAFPSLTKGMGAVIVVIGLILLVPLLARRLWPQRFSLPTSRRQIEIIESIALSDKQSLTLVRVGTTNLLLGRTAAGMTLLERVELPSEVVGADIGEVRGIDEKQSHGMLLGGHLQRTIFKTLANLKAAIRRIRLPLAWRRSTAGRTRNIKRTSNSRTFQEVMNRELQNEEAQNLLSRLSQIRHELQAR